MGPDQRVRLQVVALTAERALIEEPGRAVTAAGFLRNQDCCAHWLSQFVTRSPPWKQARTGARSSRRGERDAHGALPKRLRPLDRHVTRSLTRATRPVGRGEQPIGYLGVVVRAGEATATETWAREAAVAGRAGPGSSGTRDPSHEFL